MKTLLNIKAAVFGLLLPLLQCAGLLAQTLEVSPTSVDVAAGDLFEVEYTVKNAQVSDFQAPDFSPFVIAGGPNLSQSTRIFNGKVSMAVSRTYILAAPSKTGLHLIPAATATAGGKTLRSEKVKVKVGKGSSASAPSGQGGGQAAQQTPGLSQQHAAAANNMFLKIEADTLNVYQGQQITAVYRLYTGVQISDYTISEVPTLTGFWVQDISPERIVPGNATIGDDFYFTYDLKKYALFPQRSGTLSISPMDVEVTARIPIQGGKRSFFQQFRNLDVNLASDTLQISVMPHPDEGKPPGFAGATGQYTMTANLGNPVVKAGESVDLSITVSGSGNIKLLSPPELDFPPQIEVFGPEETEDTYTNGDQIKGRKKFDYTLVPSEAGKYELPDVLFSYFDPEMQRYQTIRGRPPALQVAPGEGGPVPDRATAELRPASSSFRVGKKGRSAFWPALFAAGMIMPLAIFPLFYIGHRRRLAANADTDALRRRRAEAVAVKRLETAQNHLQQNDKRAFYNEIIQTLWQYVGDRFDIPSAELSKDNISQTLAARGVSNDLTERLNGILEYCEMALFAPLADADNLKGTYNDALQLITAIEGQLDGAVENSITKS